MTTHEQPSAGRASSPVRPRTAVRELVGRGDRIAVVTLPFAVVGLVLNGLFPDVFTVGGPSAALRIASIVMVVPGVVVWAWSAVLILRHVPRGELITTGPYRVVKHPLHTGVALLVLPWVGFLLDSWLGAALGALLYVASRVYAQQEDRELARTFGDAWLAYSERVWLPWL